MMKLLFVLLTSGVLLVTGEDTCGASELDRIEPEEQMEPMWSTRPPLDCSTESIDAAMVTKDKKVIFFKGDWYWRLEGSKVAPGYPRLISQDWYGLPGHLDAALTWKNGRTFFFKGHQYWSFHNRTMDAGYPRNISEGFCGLPDNIDAALLYLGKNAYFFKGEDSWYHKADDPCNPISKYSGTTSSSWGITPKTVEAALEHGGKTHFIKEGYYYTYGTRTSALIHGNLGLKCEQLKCLIPRTHAKSPEPLNEV